MKELLEQLLTAAVSTTTYKEGNSKKQTQHYCANQKRSGQPHTPKSSTPECAKLHRSGESSAGKSIILHIRPVCVCDQVYVTMAIVIVIVIVMIVLL